VAASHEGVGWGGVSPFPPGVGSVEVASAYQKIFRVLLLKWRVLKGFINNALHMSMSYDHELHCCYSFLDLQ